MSSHKQDSPQLVPSPVEKEEEPDFKIQRKVPSKARETESVKEVLSKRSGSESRESKAYRFVS